MLKDIVLIKNKLVTTDKNSLVMSLFSFMASSPDEQHNSYRDLYSDLMDAIGEQSVIEILSSNSNKTYVSTQLHDNLSRYHHLLLSIAVSHDNIESDDQTTHSVFFINLQFLTGDIGIVLNMTLLESQIEFPDWMGYIETPDALYLPNGIVPTSSGLYKTFKYKQKFYGLKCK